MRLIKLVIFKYLTCFSFVYCKLPKWEETNEVDDTPLKPDRNISYESIINGIDRKIVYNDDMNTRYVKLHLVIDSTSFIMLDSSIEKTRNWALKLTYLVDALWQHANLRVYLSLLDILTEKETQAIKLNPRNDTVRDVLVKFRNYNRKTKTDDDYEDSISASIFLTSSNWTDKSVKGRASNAPCTVDGVAIIEFNKNAESLVYLFSHELAHIFQMKHPNEYNDDRCLCNKNIDSQGCIVSSGYNFEAKNKPQFTICDIEAFNDQILTCVDNPPDMFVSSKCGNMIIEPGEDCDCGSSLIECQDPCCNFSTCALKKGAECSRGPCCNQCKYRTKDSVCRVQQAECDLPEMCTGDSEWCPDDIYKWNGLSCLKKTGFCWDGICQVRDRQCQSIWGRGAQSALPKAFDLNKGGINVQGPINNITTINCGLDDDDNYVPCSEEDKFCGGLLCRVGKQRNQILDPLGYSIISGIFVLYSKHPDHKAVGKVAVGTECGTDEHRGICVKRKNIHKCDYNLTKYNPTSCETTKGVLCGGSNKGYCNQYGRCLCKDNYNPETNCIDLIPANATKQALICYSCHKDANCSKIYKSLIKSTICPRSDMACYSTRFRYRIQNTTAIITHTRGCITMEKCVPGCITENHVEKCTKCCNHSNCNF